MAWFHNGRKYWYHNGKRYSRKIKFKKRYSKLNVNSHILDKNTNINKLYYDIQKSNRNFNSKMNYIMNESEFFDM